MEEGAAVVGLEGPPAPPSRANIANPRALAPRNTSAALTVHIINLSYEDAIAVELSDLRTLPRRQ